ncbi:hypothetical protein EU527_03515 [Candidatus Thorarchaeota archaeon]|nr:MAG: hypothetical protein EU527_03515 [Candidatus Thorarchaeota archaeon]
MAKKAVDSTLKRILNYTAEIIMSIILLIFISIPLIFAIPMWFQSVLFGVSRPELSINPIAWFGLDGAILITLLLGLISFSMSYVYILKMKPGFVSSDVKETVEKEDLEEESVDFEEALEDIEDDEEIAREDQEEDIDFDEIGEDISDDESGDDD